MARRQTDIPETAVAAVDEFVDFIWKFKFLDEESGSEIEPPEGWAETKDFFTKRLNSLLEDPRMPAAWKTMDEIARGVYRNQGPANKHQSLIPLVVALSNTTSSTYSYLQAIRVENNKSLDKLSFHAAKIVKLIEKLERDYEHTPYSLTADIFEGSGSEVYKSRLRQLSVSAAKSRIEFSLPIERAISSRKSSVGDVKGHIRYLLAYLMNEYGVIQFDLPIRQSVAAFLDLLVENHGGVTTDDVTKIIRSDFRDLLV